MQYSWLEKLTKEGHVREEVRDRIYQDCGVILEKIASPEDIAKLKLYFSQKGETLANWGMIGGAALLAGTVFDQVRSSGELKSILKNKQAILNSPECASHKEKAGARFDELVKFAPKVAVMPDLSHKMIVGALHSGFTDSDIRHLSSLQASYAKEPGAAATSYAAYKGKLSKKATEKTAALCGRGLADILCIVKEASLAEKIKKITTDPHWTASKHLLTTMAALTGAHMLIGLGSGAVNVVRDKLDRKNLEASLKKSFDEAMKQSDPTREPLHANKDSARLAFQTLTHFAPHMAVEPSAARAFMNAIVSHGLGTSVGTVKELSEIERNLKGAKGSNPFIEGLAGGLEVSGFGSQLGKALQTGMEPITEHGQAEMASGLYQMEHKDPTYAKAGDPRHFGAKRQP